MFKVIDVKKYNRSDILNLFRQAEVEKFAIPAFNYSDLWDMTAIVEAAEEERSPVMLMADPPVYETIGPEMCACMADALIEGASVPVIHHLDHSAHRSACRQAGFSCGRHWKCAWILCGKTGTEF